MMLSGFFTCLFDFWVLFCWSFFKCKIALATLRKRWAIHNCLSWTFPAPNSQDIFEQSSCFWQTQRLSMIYLWYSSTFLIQRNSGNYEINPIGSMYGIYTYIWLIFMVDVGKYTIHGSYGNQKTRKVEPLSTTVNAQGWCQAYQA